MPSHKPRTTTKSTGLQNSRRTEGSSRTANSSPSAPASFEDTFGKNLSQEKMKLHKLQQDAERTLQDAMTEPEPRVALYRVRRQAKLNRLRRHIAMLYEAISQAD